jgi:hypothetical protein
LYILAGSRSIQHFVEKGLPVLNSENLFCLRCNRELEPGVKSVAMYMFAQTVGVRPRQKSSAQRICFCALCCVSLAMGPPPEGALNAAAWQMIREIVGADSALTEAAWQDLQDVAGLLPDSNEPAPSRRVAGGYLEF